MVIRIFNSFEYLIKKSLFIESKISIKILNKINLHIIKTFRCFLMHAQY